MIRFNSGSGTVGPIPKLVSFPRKQTKEQLKEILTLFFFFFLVYNNFNFDYYE